MKLIEELTAIDIIAYYLKEHAGKVIANHKIAEELPDFGKFHFRTLFSPTTYDRKWRLIKASQEIQSKNGIRLKKTEKSSREDNYLVELI